MNPTIGTLSTRCKLRIKERSVMALRRVSQRRLGADAAGVGHGKSCCDQPDKPREPGERHEKAAELTMLIELSSPVAKSSRPKPITHFGNSFMKAAGIDTPAKRRPSGAEKPTPPKAICKWYRTNTRYLSSAMPGRAITLRTDAPATISMAVATPPKSAMNAPAAFTPRNRRRLTMDAVKIPSTIAAPKWKKAQARTAPGLARKKVTITSGGAVGAGK